MEVRPLKRAKRFVRYWLLRALYFCAGLLPLSWAMGLGVALARLCFRMSGKWRRVALQSLSTAFPEKSEARRLKIADACCVHFGKMLGEMCCIEEIAQELDAYVELPPADRDAFLAACGEGKGVLLATGHIGNFELMARRLGLLGHPSNVVGKVSSDPRMTAFIDRLRRGGGYAMIWRGREKGAAYRAIGEALDRGEAVGLLVDQDTKGHGLFVDFFRKPAYTPCALADLAIDKGCAVVFAYIHRRPEGGHRVHVERVHPRRSGDRDADVKALLQEVTSLIERAIREQPEAWAWFHERWKRRPPAGAAEEEPPVTLEAQDHRAEEEEKIASGQGGGV